MQGMGSGVEMYKKGTSLLSHTLGFFCTELFSGVEQLSTRFSA